MNGTWPGISTHRRARTVRRAVVTFFSSTLLVSAGCGLAPTPEERLEAAAIYIEKAKYQKAYEMLRPLYGTGNTEVMYLLGKAAKQQTEYNKAIEIYLPLAESGDARTFFPLAQSYEHSDQYDEALPWLRKSYDAGDAEARFQLAKAYFEGRPVERDRARAYELIQEAATLSGQEEKAIGWTIYFGLREEMEQGPDSIPPGSCVVYYNHPGYEWFRPEEESMAWCDDDLDEAVKKRAVSTVQLYLDEYYRYSWDYVLKVVYREAANGHTFEGHMYRFKGHLIGRVSSGSGRF